MTGSKEWFVRTADGKVYGPADVSALVKWAEDGRIETSSSVSTDRVTWMPAPALDVLEMDWLVAVNQGNVFGPFNRKVVSRLFADQAVPATAEVYRRHRLAIDEDPPPTVRVVEKIVEKIVRVEVPVEKVVERVVEVLPPSQTYPIEARQAAQTSLVPQRRGGRSLFGGVDRTRLAALEAAAARELAALREKQGGKGFFGSLFGRRRP